MRSAVATIALTLLAAAVGACAGGSSTTDGRVQVVAGFAPLFEAARRVGGTRVGVVNLTPAGAEPHDFELATDDVDRVEDADVVLYLGAGFQPAVAEVAKRARGRAVDLLPADAGGDPHVWLDPHRFAAIVVHVRDALVAADAAGANTYRANADAYVTELDGLDAEYAAGLKTCDRRSIVTSHAAFGHLAARYGLQQRSIAGQSPEAEPDPARLAELADEVAADGVTTIFTEKLVAPDIAETLARESSVTTAVLDPIEGLAKGDDYLAAMRRNLATLRTALGCT